MKSVKELLPFLECRCGRALSETQTELCCDCGATYPFVKDGVGVVFEEVYSAESSSAAPLDLSLIPKKKKGNWRQQNMRITKEWIDTLSKGAIVADLGCGRLTNRNLFGDLKTIYIDGAKFEGIDITCDFSKKFPLRSSCLDGLLCSNVLEHLPHPQMCFDEIFRTLKPGGQSLILVPFIIKLHQQPYDFHRYTKYALGKYARDAGFSKIEIREVGGFSNIIGTILKVAKRNASSPFESLALQLQSLIFRLHRKIYDDGCPSEEMPQGYSMFLSK